ncbi:SusC/RagA family TonB-linked outer membrane protein [Butyricimonas hominis]|uniref:SusC/RagA family TonB-linked outer membrane protein n=1 Tax=Butyricimonas TaxID=574697 RepID=UPI003511EFB4
MKKNYKTKVFCRLSVMRVAFCSILLLSLNAFWISSSVYGQQNVKRISLKQEQVSVLDALREINRLSDNMVVFKKEEVEKETKRVTIDLKDVTVLDAVKACVESTNLTCVEYAGRVVVTPKKEALSLTITGVVRDDKGEPLPGATIVLKTDSLQIGTSADVQGAYRLTVPTSATTLVFSFMGYKTKEVAIKGQTTINVVLDEDVMNVEEVVVTGIFTRKAESYSGSAVTIRGEELKRVGNQNLFQSLKNLDPSLLIMDNIAQGSNPNAMPNMQLRGASTFPTDETSLKSRFQDDPNTPLFILDGFETTTEKIFDMDMNRIESVTILKDAAAKAIYGSKAANGVVVIETKRAPQGQTLVSYVGSLDLEMPDLTSYDLTNALEKLEVERREGYYESLGTFVDDKVDYMQLYNERLRRAKEGLDTYWLSKPLRTSVGQKHSLQVEIGTEMLSAIGSFSYNDVKGVMKGSDRRVIGGDLNLSYRAGKVLFRDIMSVSSMKSNDSPYGDFSTYAALNPYVSPYDESGNLVQYLDDFTTGSSTLGNPLFDAKLGVKQTDTYLDFTNNFYVEIQPYEGWKLMARLGMTSKRTDSEDFYPSDHSKFKDYSSDEDSQLRKGSYEMSNGKSWTISGDFSVQFSKAIKKHDLFATAQWSVTETKYSEVTHYTEGFPNKRMNSIIFARQYAKESTPTGSNSIQRELRYVVLGGYSYDNRFLADLTLQGSAASVFGTDNKWGTFWSLGLAWNIHNEKFMENSNIRQLKLRGSVGTTGNQNFASNLSMSVYNYYTNKYYQGFSGAYLANMENPDLGWEEKVDYTIGLDANVGNLLLKFDAYIADTKNMAFNRSLVTSTGFSVVRDNLGKVRNKGIELSATYSVIRKKDAFLNVYFKIATNDNRVKKISDALRSYNEQMKQAAIDEKQTMPVAIYQDGKPLNSIWAVKSLGIDPNTGQEVFLDLDGNKTFTWSAANLVYCGSSDPKYNGNFGFNGEYKGLGLSAVFTYYGGGKMYNNTLVSRVENCYIGNNVDRRVFSDRWYYSGQNAQYINGYKNGGTQATSRFVQKDNVLTISSLSLYYEIPQDIVKRMYLQRLKLGVYMNDVATFSSIKVERGTSYPFARTLSFSLQGTF